MATTPAVLGPQTRLNNFRLAYLPAAVKPIRKTRVLLFIDGVLARYRHGSMSIRDALNDAPNTCSFEVFAPVPPQAGERVRVTINTDAPRLLFAGAIQTDGLTFVGRPANKSLYPCSALDDTWRANRRLPLGAWQNVSASTVVAELVAAFCPGFTATHVQPGLPAVTVYYDGSEGINGALTQLARLVGGYFYWEDSDLHFFQTEATDAPDPVTTGGFLHAPAIQRKSDDSQIRTRVYGKGYGIALPTEVLAGETILPILDTVLFAGGSLIVFGVKASGSTTQRGTYSGVQGGGAGTLIGPGASPSVKPLAVVISGTGLGIGAYQYAYTFVTGSGESVLSPVAAVTTSGTGVPNPTAAPTAANVPNSGVLNSTAPIGQAQQFVYAYSTVASLIDYSQQTLPSAAVGITTISNGDPLNPTRSAPVRVTVPTSSDARVKGIYVYENNAVSGGYRIVGGIANNPGVSSLTLDVASNVTATGQLAPAANTTPPGCAVTLNGIAIGPTGTTQRKVYRTVVNGSSFKLQQTIANNTATSGGTDTTADGALGATAPATDTSGLTPLGGQITAGATAILTSGAGTLPAAGWVRTPADEYVRYTGISGNTLTGIPASGPGAILTTLKYGDPIVPAAALVGVVGITSPLEKGAPVHVWVQRDDFVAQAEMAARESTATDAGDGIYEHLIRDERRGQASMTALCDADLALFARPIVTVTYDTRDVKTKSGKTVTIDIAAPAIHETLTIHDVTITELDIAPGLAPRFSVAASSVRFSLEDMLRRLTAQLDGSGS